MIRVLERVARPLLHLLDPEDAHAIAIGMLNIAPLPRAAREHDPRLAVRAFGLKFSNPIGMAAGFDKNGEVPDALLRLGFGFVEVGTVTPLPQPGNPRPRLFRLDADQALVNRLGFNSQGADAVLKRLAARAQIPSRSCSANARGRGEGVVGVNIGANKDASDRIAGYVRLVERFAAVAGYIAINVSSPNTPGLRDLQQAATLDDLLARLVEARERSSPSTGPVPVLLKIAPDLSLADLDAAVAVARARRIDGMIIGNTTLGRPASLRDASSAGRTGGLSGRPLFALATRMLAETYVRVDGAFPLIGVGGIDSGAAALAKFRAGARLVQLYSALVFRGLSLVAEIETVLIAALENSGSGEIAALVGTDAAAVTAEPWPR